MECGSCGADLDPSDRYCPACRLPNPKGLRQPRFGPPLKEPGPIIAPREVRPGRRPCPRCRGEVSVGDHYCRSCGLDVSELPPLREASRASGVWTTPGPQGLEVYKPLRGLTRLLQVLAVAVGLAGVVLGVLAVLLWRELGGGRVPYLSLPRSDYDWDTLYEWARRLAVVQVGMVVVAWVLLVSWCHRAYQNLGGMDVEGRRYASRWAVWGWLVPGVNLIVPKTVVDETWRASDPMVLPPSTAWRGQPVPTTIHLWWICTLVALPTVGLALVELAGMTLPPPGLQELHAAQSTFLLLAVAEGLVAFATALFVRTIGGIDDRQARLADRIGSPSVLDDWGGGPSAHDGSDGPAAPHDLATTSDDRLGPTPTALFHVDDQPSGRY